MSKEQASAFLESKVVCLLKSHGYCINSETDYKSCAERSKKIYKSGKSRGPYRLNRSVNESLSKSSTQDEGLEVGTNLELGMCTISANLFLQDVLTLSSQ